MARIRVGDAEENVVTRDEWPLERALESLKDETIAVLGYGVQRPGQALNLRDNGFRVIVGQRRGSRTWDKAVEDGWIEGETLFETDFQKEVWSDLTGERGILMGARSAGKRTTGSASTRNSARWPIRRSGGPADYCVT